MHLPHSSNVVLRMLVDGVEFVLSHVGSRYVILRECQSDIPPTNATLLVNVDGSTNEREVYLPHGIQSGKTRVSYF